MTEPREETVDEGQKAERGGDVKTIIAGSRSITDYDEVRDAVESCPFRDRISLVVSGTARGVDRAGEKWAKENGLPVVEFPAEWDEHGKRAGFIRNREMAGYADALVAVWDGESRGTKMMIRVALNAGLLTHVVYPTDGAPE